MLGNAQPNAFNCHPLLNEPFSSTRLDGEHPPLRDCRHLNQKNLLSMNPQKMPLVLALYGISTCLFAQDKITAFYIGHSLSDQIPDMVASLSNQGKPGTFNWTYQGISESAPLQILKYAAFEAVIKT